MVSVEDRFQERSIKPSQQGATQKRQNVFEVGHAMPYPTIAQFGPPPNAMRGQLIAKYPAANRARPLAAFFHCSKNRRDPLRQFIERIDIE
jgi:hypothetical protein